MHTIIADDSDNVPRFLNVDANGRLNVIISSVSDASGLKEALRLYFEIDFISSGGNPNYDVSCGLAPASYVEIARHGDAQSLTCGYSREAGHTGIWMAGNNESVASPIGKTVKFLVQADYVAIFYDDVEQAAAHIDWKESTIRFWLRVRSGGTTGEEGFAVYDNFGVNGTIVDDFTGSDDDPPNPAIWNTYESAANDGVHSIQSNRLRTHARKTAVGGEAWNALRHKTAYSVFI